MKYQGVLALLTDPDSVRIVHTDITDPGLLSLLLLSAVPADSQKEFKESVEGLVEIGQHLVKLKWKAPASVRNSSLPLWSRKTISSGIRYWERR